MVYCGKPEVCYHGDLEMCCCGELNVCSCVVPKSGGTTDLIKQDHQRVMVDPMLLIRLDCPDRFRLP